MSGDSEAGNEWRTDPYRWVVEDDIPTVVARMQAIREGEGSPEDPDRLDPQPGEAMRILQKFALERGIDDLLSLEREAESSHGFAPLDARAVLTLAALIRPVKQAAALAIKQWEQEGAFATEPTWPQLTDRILHDVTAQRPVQDVAEFAAECRKQGAVDLVFRALKAFVMTETSGRTSLDKALLYLALRDEGCPEEAAFLLEQALLQAGKDSADRETAGSPYRAGVVGALRHLSPSERIVEDWIEKRLEDDRKEQDTIELAANLLLGEPEGSKALAAHIGLTWIPRRLIDLCRILVRHSGEEEVRRHVAIRSDKESLAELIEQWHRSGPLAGTLKDLLGAIVAGGDGTSCPREIEFLDSLHQVLVNRHAPAECRRELRIATASHVEGRTGAEVASLLAKVERRERYRAAQNVNRGLTELLLEGEIDAANFVAYLNGLGEWRSDVSTLTFWALRELSEPTAPDYEPENLAPAVGDIAFRLYGQGRARTGFDLLERCLENEQWLDAHGAVDIVSRMRPGLQPDDTRWDALLSATVGRWADTQRRDEVVAALRQQRYYEDADAIIRSVQ